MSPTERLVTVCSSVCVFQIEVMHDYHGNRSCLYGSNTETDSEVEDNPEQVTRYVVLHLRLLRFDLCRSIFINKPLLILCRHIIKELIATERIYVDELLSVLLVSLQMFVGFFFCCCIFQLLLTAFFSPSSPLLRATGQKWKTRPCLTSFPQLCAVRKTFCLATCLRFTSFTAGKTRNQHTCKCCCVFFCGKVT